jgi:hypothetical protein
MMKRKRHHMKRLSFERVGVQNRKPAYIAFNGVDSIDGGKATYHLYNEGGVYRLSGNNVRRAGGQRIVKNIAEGKAIADQIDEAAERAFHGGYSLSKDLV